MAWVHYQAECSDKDKSMLIWRASISGWEFESQKPLTRFTKDGAIEPAHALWFKRIGPKPIMSQKDLKVFIKKHPFPKLEAI